MKKILFYSQRLYKYFYDRKECDGQIIDYFDIEVQKILRTIGYTYKMNPIIIHSGKQFKKADASLVYDLDSFSVSSLESQKEFIGVVYDCG